MTLQDLKSQIESKSHIPLPLVFLDNNSDFLISTYLAAIASNNDLTPLKIANIAEINKLENDLFFESTHYLFIYEPPSDLEIRLEEIKDKNVIVVYKNSLPKDYKEKYIEFDPLQNWQVEDYVAYKLPGLNRQETDWLCQICKYNIERLNLEIKKINIFNKEEQQTTFQEINNADGWSDLSSLTIFNLTNSIVKKDIIGIKHTIQELGAIDIEATGLLTLLKRNFLNIIRIQTNKKSNAQTLGLSYGQFKAISYNCGKYSNEELQDIYEFLVGVDQKLKSGRLEMSNQNFVQYILNNTIGRLIK